MSDSFETPWIVTPPGSPTHGNPLARVLEKVAISFFRGPSQHSDLTCISYMAAAAAAVTSVLSDSGRPHRRQPTRLPRPWDSPGKNTGVGCHFLLQCMKVKVKSLSRVRPSVTLWTAAYQAPLSMGFSRQEYWSGVPLPSPKLDARRGKIKHWE